MGEWIPYDLGELIEVQNGYAFKSKDFDDFKGIPVIKIKTLLLVNCEWMTLSTIHIKLKDWKVL